MENRCDLNISACFVNTYQIFFSTTPNQIHGFKHED